MKIKSGECDAGFTKGKVLLPFSYAISSKVNVLIHSQLIPLVHCVMSDRICLIFPSSVSISLFNNKDNAVAIIFHFSRQRIDGEHEG